MASLVPEGSGQVNAPAPKGQLRQDVYLDQLSGICDHYLELLCIPCGIRVLQGQ